MKKAFRSRAWRSPRQSIQTLGSVVAWQRQMKNTKVIYRTTSRLQGEYKRFTPRKAQIPSLIQTSPGKVPTPTKSTDTDADIDTTALARYQTETDAVKPGVCHKAITVTEQMAPPSENRGIDPRKTFGPHKPLHIWLRKPPNLHLHPHPHKLARYIHPELCAKGEPGTPLFWHPLIRKNNHFGNRPSARTCSTSNATHDEMDNTPVIPKVYCQRRISTALPLQTASTI